ncbi:MAG TPA: NnrS family protein [Casimicrobiaceae bacterium]|nr:NnrS family protein [Casimicrobiaceae bacterium]
MHRLRKNRRRVLLPLAAPSLYNTEVVASAVLWSAAYAIYAVRYWPVLTRPRSTANRGEPTRGQGIAL